jgi:phosphoglycolate phosphatase
MLILFDIDGTLLSSEGVGVRSIEEAGELMFKKPFSLEGIPIGGRLDPLIWNDACVKHDIDNPESHHDEFRTTYTSILATNLQSVKVSTYPGVLELLEACRSIEHTACGIVTGNYEETGKMKLQAAGIDTEMFTANAWGTDGVIRDELPPVAMSRSSTWEPTILIGDTIHDVTSGKKSGCNVIAVCTGSNDRETLHSVNPDLLLDDLSDTEAILHWMHNIHNPSP